MAVFSAFNEADGLYTITNISGLGVSTLTGVAITDVARGGFTLDIGGNVAVHTLPSELTTGWVHVVTRGRIGVSNLALQFFTLRDAAGNSLVGIGHTNSTTSPTYPYVLGTIDLGTELAAAAAGANTYDIHFNIANSGGFFHIYVNEALAFSFTGDTMPAASGCADIRFSGAGLSANVSVTAHFGQVVVADTPTIGARVHTLPISAFGATNNWSGVVSDINAAGLTTNTITANAVDNTVTFTKGTLSALNLGNVIASVGVGLRGYYASGSAVTQLQDTARVGGVNYFGDILPLALGAENAFLQFTSNPATSGAWDIAAVNAAEFGFRAKA